MLPKTKMVRRAVESLYDGVCSVIEHQGHENSKRITEFEDVTVYENIPCRLSFQSLSAAEKPNGAAENKQLVKLFCATELNIKPGSKIRVTQNNVTVEFKSSGVPAVYESHQEIILERFERWA